MVGGNPSVGGGGFAASPAGTAPLYYKSAEIASGSAKNLCKKSEMLGGVPCAAPATLATVGNQGEFAFFAACQPCLSLAFLPPIPPTPFPSGEGGAPKFIPPGASPPAPLHLTACGTHRACQAGTRRGACPVGRLLPLPLSFFSAPYPPSPLPRRGRGSPRLFHARGFAPCIPGAEPRRHLQNLPSRYPAAEIRVCRKTDRKRFPMSSAGSQGEGGPGERNFGV